MFNWRVSIEAIFLSWWHFTCSVVIGLLLGAVLVFGYVPIYYIFSPRGETTTSKDHLQGDLGNNVKILGTQVELTTDTQDDYVNDDTVDTSVLEFKKDI